MKIILEIIKYFIFICLVGSVISVFCSEIYTLIYPLVPVEQAEKLEASYFGRFIQKEDQTILVSIGILLFMLSLFVVSFAFFPRYPFFSKFVIGCGMIVGLMLFVWLIDNQTVTYVLYAVFPVLSVFILAGKIKPLWRQPKGQRYAKSKAAQDSGFAFPTEKGIVHVANPYRGIYIQGGAGSGKSETLFKAILRQSAEKGYTGLLYDFKSPELSKIALNAYKNTDIPTYHVDFKNPGQSHRVNPIDPRYLEKTAYALEYSQILINNLIPESTKNMDFWAGNARMILAGLIWYLRTHYPAYCTLAHVVSVFLHCPVNSMIERIIKEDSEAGGLIAGLRESIERGAERQTAGILTTLQNGLTQLHTPDIFYLLSGNDFSLQLNNPQHPAFLCIGNDSTLYQTYAPAIALITGVALRQMNRSGQLPSVVAIDEAASLTLPNFEQIPATGRSNKIATVFGVQDYSQIAERYGAEKAQVILSNLGTQFYGRTVNARSAEMIKNLFSREDRTYKSRSTGGGTSGKFVHLSSNTNKGTTDSIQERDRVKVSDIISLRPGQFYGINSEGQPSEFLRTTFLLPAVSDSFRYEREHTALISQNEMKRHFDRIITESKTLFPSR